LEHQIIYSAKQIEYLIEVAKTLIPISMAFLGFVIVVLSKVEERKIIFSSTERLLVIGVLLWSIISIGFWCGVLACMIDCSHVYERFKETQLFIPIATLNWEFQFGQRLAKTSLFVQTISVFLFCYIAYKKTVLINEK
jgi:hypothetical protein